MPSDEQGFTQFLGRAKNGDQAAMSLLLRKQDVALNSYVNKRLERNLRVTVAIDDILQETYLTAFRTIVQFQGDTAATFRSWLMGIAENKMREARKAVHAKKRGGEHHRVEADRTTLYGKLVERVAHSDPTPSRCIAIKEGGQHLALALASLRPDDRQILELRFFHSMPFDKVGERVGITAEAAKKRSIRALKRLRESMGEDPRLAPRR